MKGIVLIGRKPRREPTLPIDAQKVENALLQRATTLKEEAELHDGVQRFFLLGMSSEFRKLAEEMHHW